MAEGFDGMYSLSKGNDSYKSMPIKDIKSEIDDIIKKILRLCKLQKGVNIFLLGKSGAGKSAFINTMYKAISGEYHKIANTAKGNTQSITPALIWYDHCGVVIELVDNEERQIQLSGCLKHFPNIIDFAGLGDEDTDCMRVILDRVLGGCIEAGTDYSKLTDLQTLGGADCLNRDKLPGRAVTHVVFVQSWRDSVPVKLIECLTKVMKQVDEYGARMYPVDVTVLLTRYDELKYPSAGLTPEEKEKNKDDFKKCKQEIAQNFRFEGAESDYIVEWINYSENIKAEKKYEDNRKELIDLEAIKLLKSFLEPSVPKQRPQRKLIDLNMRFKIMKNTTTVQYVLFALIVVVLSMVISYLLSIKA